MSKDISFFEDAELNCKRQDTVTAVIKHLLAGHQGCPCPAGSRPIVGGTNSSRRASSLGASLS
jgi:hypothetical protein